MNNIVLNIDRLIECREKMGYSKQKTAQKVGISQPAYVRYETGARTPSIQVVKELARVLNTSVEYLTNATNSPTVNCYIVENDQSPQLFDIIKMYHELDIERQSRLHAYAIKLTKK